jgi:hypothetical protein
MMSVADNAVSVILGVIHETNRQFVVLVILLGGRRDKKNAWKRDD